MVYGGSGLNLEDRLHERKRRGGKGATHLFYPTISSARNPQVFSLPTGAVDNGGGATGADG